MIKYFIILLFCCQAFAQYPVLNDSIKKPGIYKTFDEFKNNSPSVALNNTIITKNNILFTHWGKETINTYSLDMPKEESKALGNVYGFCDGFNFYVTNSDNTLLAATLGKSTFYTPVHKSIFYKISGMGKYPYLDIPIGSNMSSVTTGGDFDLSKAASIDLAVIYFETGEIKRLTVKLLKEILADKPALLEKFKKQESKYDYLKVYLKEYLKN